MPAKRLRPKTSLDKDWREFVQMGNICLQGVPLKYNRAMAEVKFKAALPSQFAIAAFSLMTGLQAQAPATEAGSVSPPAVPPQAAAYRTDTAPVLDGDVLGDPAWQTGGLVTDFWQTTPFEGQPASERTVVRILYDDRNLYIGVICYDRSPEEIIVSDSRRDASLTETDSFQFILDTFNDGQNGFVFGTNPAAIEYDGQVSREGQGTHLTGSISKTLPHFFLCGIPKYSEELRGKESRFVKCLLG